MKRSLQPAAASEPVPVTVIIPAYNRPAMTRRAVVSAMRQQPLPPAEILVVDDCSTDGTGDAAREAGARVIRHETNRGEGAARNTALRQARHDWVALLDSDDEWLPNHLASLWPFREGNVLLAGSALRRRPQGDHRFIGPVTVRATSIRSPADIAVLRYIAASAVMIRRDVALDVGAFRPLPRAADLDLWLRVLERGPGYASQEVSIIYHEHPGQISDDESSVQKAARAVLSEYLDRPWMTPGIIDAWDSVIAWDGLRSALARGDRPLALARLGYLLARPVRIHVLLSLLRWRWRERRRSGRLTPEGRPSVAVLCRDVETARTAGERFGTRPRILAHGRPLAYLELARRPAAVLVVKSALDAAIARALGMIPDRLD